MWVGDLNKRIQTKNKFVELPNDSQYTMEYINIFSLGLLLNNGDLYGIKDTQLFIMIIAVNGGHVARFFPHQNYWYVRTSLEWNKCPKQGLATLRAKIVYKSSALSHTDG